MRSLDLVSSMVKGMKAAARVHLKKKEIPQDFNAKRFLDALDSYFDLNLDNNPTNKNQIHERLVMRMAFFPAYKRTAWTIFQKMDTGERVSCLKINRFLKNAGVEINPCDQGSFELGFVEPELMIG